MIKKYPFVSDDKEWKTLVNSELYSESRNLGRKLTVEEKRSVVKSLKRHLYLRDESVGLNPTKSRVYRCSSNSRVAYGLAVPRRLLGSIESFEDFYVDFLTFKKEHFDDVTILVQPHHRKNIRSMLDRITEESLQRLLQDLFRKGAPANNDSAHRGLWSEYTRLCSITYYSFFYMICLGYLALVAELKLNKYYVYDVNLGINGGDLNHLSKHYLQYFKEMCSDICFEKDPVDEVSFHLVQLLGCAETGKSAAIIEEERRSQLERNVSACVDRIQIDLERYGIDKEKSGRIIDKSSLLNSVKDRSLAKTVYFSDILKSSDVEGKINRYLNDLRQIRESMKFRTLGANNSNNPNRQTTALKYIEFDWPTIESYDGSSDIEIYKSFVNVLVSYDMVESKSSSSGMFGHVSSASSKPNPRGSSSSRGAKRGFMF